MVCWGFRQVEAGWGIGERGFWVYLWFGNGEKVVGWVG